MVREELHSAPSDATLHDEDAPAPDAAAAPRESPAAAARRPPLIAIQTPVSAVKRKQPPIRATLNKRPAPVPSIPTIGTRKPTATRKPAASLTSEVSVPVEAPKFNLVEDPSSWKDNSVQVVIRVRPLNSAEKSQHGYRRCLKQNNAKSVTWIGPPETHFTFDHVACEATNQEEVFKVVGLPVIEKCMDGHNSCIFAYGQTGSGKSHTMLGKTRHLEVEHNPDRGMSPRIFEVLFAKIKEEEESRSGEKLTYNCKCSFLEIYNNQITDLLNPSSTNLPIRGDGSRVYVENLTEIEVRCVHDVVNLLMQGSSNRKVAATNMNHESSRSHSIFTCKIKSMWEKEAIRRFRSVKLNLVDLAGSERAGISGAEGETLKEANYINQSLLTLSHVIKNLADVANGRQRHVPYRDSNLTHILQNSLGGNANTMIIANISPSIGSASETLSTLRFAQKARLLQNKAVINEIAKKDMELKDCSSDPESVLSLLLELDILKTILVQEITARREAEELLKKRDMEVSELTERYQQYRASESYFEQQVQLLERTISDLEATVSTLENKVDILKKEAESQRVQLEEQDELLKIRTRSSMETTTKHGRDNSDAERAAGKKRARRQACKWSLSEEEALKKGVEEYGHGRWKDILMNNPDCFNGRTAVDLKDKWRNMMNASNRTHR